VILVAFRYNDRRLFARLVCLLRGGDSAHCEGVYRSVNDMHGCVSSSFIDGGVREKIMPLPAEKWRMYEVPEAVDPRAWLVQHTGKKYDLLGLLGILLPTLGHSRRRWFCSEAVADMLGLSEPHLFDLRSLESVCALNGKRIQ